MRILEFDACSQISVDNLYISVLKLFTLYKKGDPIMEMPGPGEFVIVPRIVHVK